MFKRVLVTGGAGFIGSHVVDLLLERGCAVRVFDNLEPQVHGAAADGPPTYLSAEAEFVRGDVRDRAALSAALRDVDAVMHYAAMVGVGQSQYEISRYVSANTLGTAELLDVIVNERRNVQRVLMASSMSIYGEGLYRRPSDGALVAPPLRPDEQLARHDFEMRDADSGEALEPAPTPESKPLACASIYAQAKKDQEEMTFIAGRAHKLPTVAGRFFNAYGPRQSLSNPYTGVGAIFSSRLKNGKAPIIYEDGRQCRDFIHVRELAAACVFLLEEPRADGEPYNIGTGRATSILELARLLARLHGREEIAPEINHQFRSGDIRHCYADASKLAALGWRATLTPEEGLRQLAEWSERQDAVDQVETAHAELKKRGLVME